MPQMDILDN